MDYMDSNKIGQRIENKLIHALGRTISEATNDEIYKAAAECIRDDIMISWADSRKRVQEQGVKKLYYMSAEFLMGRAFSNNLINKDYMRHIGKHSGRWDLILIRSRMKKMMQDLEMED